MGSKLGSEFSGIRTGLRGASMTPKHPQHKPPRRLYGRYPEVTATLRNIADKLDSAGPRDPEVLNRIAADLADLGLRVRGRIERDSRTWPVAGVHTPTTTGAILPKSESKPKGNPK